MKITSFKDLNYQSLLEELYRGELGLMVYKSSLSGMLLKICKFLYRCLKSLNPFAPKVKFTDNIDTLIVISSLNQYRALEKLINNLPNTFILSTFPIDCKNNAVIDTNGDYWISLFNLPKLLFYILQQKGFKHKTMLYHFDEYLNTPGVYRRAVRHLKAAKPKSVLVANDHIFFTRSYLRGAKKLEIKTIYTQHASVSSLFPVLEFDYSFLDGEESLDKYISNDRPFTSDIFLSGSPRFDKIPLISEINTYDLGIAINMLDNKENILRFLKLLTLNNIKFIVRPHPGQPDINFWKEYCKENDISYSNSITENPITFIASCKRFVVGDSAFHLEVALCKKKSYYVNFQNNNFTDGYEYIKRGLIELKSEDELINVLNSDETDEISVDKVKYYVSNFETNYWGKSADLITKTINEINGGKNYSEWINKDNRNKIYEIKF